MQFEDADEATELAAGHLPPATVDFTTPREREGAFVDESMPEDEEDEEDFDEEEEDWIERDDLQGGLYAVMDQDWADAAGGAFICRSFTSRRGGRLIRLARRRLYEAVQQDEAAGARLARRSSAGQGGLVYLVCIRSSRRSSPRRQPSPPCSSGCCVDFDDGKGR